MSKSSRDRIFGRLNTAHKNSIVSLEKHLELPDNKMGREPRIEKLKTLMEDMRTEIHVVKAENFMESLGMLLKNQGIKELLYGKDTPIGNELERFKKANGSNLPELIPYVRDIEEFKQRLFEIDASITSTIGAIADTGAIILWPDEREPRLMSLVPGMHIAVLESEKIYNTFSEIILEQDWQEGMPTNVLLISGPSKTADIELTLAYGVHGPKELILFILDR